MSEDESEPFPRFPEGVFVETLEGKDPYGTMLRPVVIWAARKPTCSGCGEPIDPNPGCPAMLDAMAVVGGQVMNRDQAHGCGTWNPLFWIDLGENPSREAMREAAEQLLS